MMSSRKCLKVYNLNRYKEDFWISNINMLKKITKAYSVINETSFERNYFYN